MASTALLDPVPGPARRPERQGEQLLLRLRVRLGRIALDRRLAAGEDPDCSPELALRARRITTRQEQLALAVRLERIVREAERPERGLTARAPLQRAAIHAARPALLNLIDALGEADHPRAQGIARVGLLLSDGCGPLWAPSEARTLERELWRATHALGGDEPWT